MIMIDAVGKNGRSILPDLDGASPTGGFVRTEWRTQYDLRPGDVLRDASGWAVIAGLAHDGILGVSTVALITADGQMTRRTLAACGGAEVRADARINPGSLWKLSDLVTGRVWHVTAA